MTAATTPKRSGRTGGGERETNSWPATASVRGLGSITRARRVFNNCIVPFLFSKEPVIRLSVPMLCAYHVYIFWSAWRVTQTTEVGRESPPRPFSFFFHRKQRRRWRSSCMWKKWMVVLAGVIVKKSASKLMNQNIHRFKTPKLHRSASKILLARSAHMGTWYTPLFFAGYSPASLSPCVECIQFSPG